jgi:phenylpropionate dioxygenase-like ring-hydroxylating dioxygenase large terminal subunit
MQRELVNNIDGLRKQAEAELGRRASNTPPKDFPALPTIPAARYTDPALYELEIDSIFLKQWLCAGIASELPEIGSYKVWNHMGIPVILVRGKDNTIHAFRNSCRHRGGSVVQGDTGTVKRFRCNFHCWNYDLDGTLKSVPDQYEFPTLDKSKHNLLPIKCEMLGNFIYINFTETAPSLEQHFGKVASELSHFDLEKRSFLKRAEFEMNCNWKLAIDAFAESYHLFWTHRNTVAPMFQSHGQVFRLWPNGHSLMITASQRENRADWIMDTGSEDPRHELSRTEQVSATIFPNSILPLGEFTFPIFNFWPTSIKSTKFEIIMTTPLDIDESVKSEVDIMLEQLEIITLEDISNMKDMQKSVETGGLKDIQLGCQERRIYQFHEEVDRQIGANNIPENLLIEPIIGAYIDE